MSEISIPRTWRLRQDYYNLSSERRMPPIKIPESREPRYGNIVEVTEIGTRNGKKESIVKVEYDSGLDDDHKNQFIFNGDIQPGCRVEIGEVKERNGVIANLKVISLSKCEIQNEEGFTISFPLKIQEASMSSR